MAAASSVQILPEQSTRFDVLRVRSTRDRYDEFGAANPTILADHGITDDTYILKPNGTDDYAGMWTPPYTLKHIWDYHVNRNWSVIDGEVFYEEDDPRYIELPDANDPKHGGYIDETTGLYPMRVRRLWDFVYNQEYLVAKLRGTSATAQRNREFPTKAPLPRIVPKFLPDATMPEHLSLRYPYAAWETAVQVPDDGNLQAQRYSYMRAHGAASKDMSVNAYNFEPHDATREFNPLVRPIYKHVAQVTTFFSGYSPMPYAPLVLRNVSDFNTNGWLSFFRQRLRAIPVRIDLPKAPRILDYYVHALEYKNATPTATIVEAAMQALPEETALLWPRHEDRPARALIPPARRENVTGRYRELNAKESEAYNVVAYIVELLELTASGGKPHLLDTNGNGSAVFYDEPYFTLAVRVQPSKASLNRFNTSFEGGRTWTLSVPPLLSANTPGNLDVYTTNARVDWYADSEVTGTLEIANVADSRHQVQVTVSDDGEYTVYADVGAALTYVFELASLKISVVRVRYNIANGNQLYNIGDEEWMGIRFASPALAFTNLTSNETVVQYLADNWSRDYLKAQNILPLSDATTVPYLDYYRPLLLVHAKSSRTLWRLVIFEVEPIRHQISAFGDQVLMRIKAPGSHTTVWKTMDDEILPGNEPVLTVVLPQQLKWYRAELYVAGVHVFTVLFNVDIAWPYHVTRHHLVRADMELAYTRERGWNKIYGVVPYTGWRAQWAEMLHPHIEEAVEALFLPEENAFFKELVYHYAYDYHADLQNYALCYPHVVEYAELMQGIVDGSRGRVAIVSELTEPLMQLLPKHLGFPLLFIRLNTYDVDDGNVHAAYIVYDPLKMEWMNLFSPTVAVLPSWQYDIPVATRARIRHLFTLTSPEYTRTHYAAEGKRRALAAPAAFVAAQRFQAYIAKLRRAAKDAEDTMNAVYKKNDAFVAEQIKWLHDTPGALFSQRKSMAFLAYMRDLFEYLHYICVNYSKLTVRAPRNDDYDFHAYVAAIDPQSEIDNAYKRYLADNAPTRDQVRAQLKLMRKVNTLRSLVLRKRGNASTLLFSARLLTLRPSMYRRDIDSVLNLAITVVGTLKK